MSDYVKARIVPNLIDVIDEFFQGKGGHRTDPAFAALCDRIAGNVVELKFIGPDAFERINDNYWLPNCCWEPVKENASGR